MTNSKKAVGRPNAPTAENFIGLYTEGVEVPNQSNVDVDHCFTAGPKILTVREVIAMCLHKKRSLKGYEHNRGPGQIVPKTIEDVAENFRPTELGSLTWAEDGTICDSHNRIGGLCLRAQRGKMTKSDWNEPVLVRVIKNDQFMSTYQGLGKCKAHTIANHLGNPDLLLGSCIIGENGISSYLEKLGLKKNDQEVLRKGSSLTVIANIMTALHMKNSNCIPECIGEFTSYADVYKVRHQMKEMAHSIEGSPIALIRPTDYARIAEGCLYYEQWRKSLRSQKAKDEFLPPINGLTGNNGLMGLIVSDIVFNEKADRQLTKVSPNTLAQRLLHRAEKVEEVLADILGSNNKNADDAIKKVVKIAQQPIEVQKED